MFARPRTSDRSGERGRLVESLARHGITDPKVLQAISDVPRHWFVPDELADRAYDDDALPIGSGQTISQPYIVALMTEALRLSSTSKVLEIGTGSGYQAAVLSELTPSVFSVEILPDRAARARAVLEERGYRGVSLRSGDGREGWPEEAPFDAILVAAAPESVPPRLLDQLKAGGRMSIPVGADPEHQWLLLLQKHTDGSVTQDPIAPVRFVRLAGKAPD
jgi:protein-L-isoaspartate(D-aspartate) O-methyltransferase